jgi:ankyrin repeat protein
MRARFVNEKFVEDSDPVTDMGIGIRAQISKFMKEIDEKDTDDNALARCAQRGKLDWVKFLIAAGANIEYNNPVTALRWASLNGHLDVVKEMLKAGADVHSSDDAALYNASCNGHLEIVKELLKAGADVHADDDKVLGAVSRNGHLDVVKELLKAGVNVHGRGDYALTIAKKYGHQDVVDFLEDYIAKEKKSKKRNIRESLVEKFVEDSDPITDMGIGMRAQISRWIEKTVEYKIRKQNGEKNIDGDDVALATCADYGKLNWVKLLIDRGADVNLDNGYALRWASAHGHLEVVKELLKAGADIHCKNPTSDAPTSLKAAKRHGHQDVVDFLEDYIAKEKKSKVVKESLNEKFVEDSDPVTDMGIGTRAQISRWMKERGEEDTDENALAECAKAGKLDWVKFLIAAGANVHFINDYALRWASGNGHLEIVKELLKAGADVHADHNYALAYAKQCDYQDVVDFLEDYIANEKKSKHRTVRESLLEKFVEDSDPVADMGIGNKDEKSRQSIVKREKDLANPYDRTVDGGFHANYVLTQESSNAKISQFRKDIATLRRQISPGMLPLLLKGLKAGYVAAISVMKPRDSEDFGYFYWYTIEDGVYDPGDIVVMQDEINEYIEQKKKNPAYSKLK